MKRILILVVLLACAGFAAGAQAQTAPVRIQVTAKRFAFTPNAITVKKGQPVELVLTSVDVAHGIRIRGLNVSVKVKAHGTAQVTFTPDQTGDFEGHCSVFCGSGHGSMTFLVHVVD